MKSDEFLSDVAVIFARGPAGEAFGSGRLIAPGLILTARHVVEFPTPQAPLQKGWKVCLIRERSQSGAWTEPAHDAELVWRGRSGLDLALLKTVGTAMLAPIVQPVFAYHDVPEPIVNAYAVGFPQAWRTDKDMVRDYTLSGHLRNASQRGAFGWAVQSADKPDSRDGWKGMSGGAVCKIGPDRRLQLLGVLESVPANFSGGLLNVSRLSDAFSDQRFCEELQLSLGYEPQIIPSNVGRDTDGMPAPNAGVRVAIALPGPIIPDTPDLPQAYRPREADIAALKSLLLSGDSNIGIVGRSRAAGIRGMGGLGKTVLATALVQDPDVRIAFSYGIVWLTFGREADALAQLIVVTRAVTDQQPGYTTVAEARADLRRILGERRLLLVLDDIWDPALVDGFRNLAPGCQLLVTTREQAVLDRVDARTHTVGLLDPSASRTLFAQALGFTDLPGEADRVIAECGGLPLALVAAAGMVRRSGWKHTQDAFTRGRLDTLKVRWLPGSEHENLAVVLAASVEALPERERACFLECAIWPEDVPIPISALGLYWSTHAADPFDQEEIADALADASVLQRDTNGMLRLHDLYHDYLRHRACENLVAMHGMVADRCIRFTESGCELIDGSDWTLARLPWHLVQAARPAQAKALLLDYRWLASKLATYGVQALIADTQLIADPDCRLVASALTMAGASLMDPEQLPAQLAGRLERLSGSSATLRNLLEKARTHASTRALLPKRVFLPSIAQGVHRVIQIGVPVLSGILSSDKVHLVIGLRNGTVQIWDWRRQDRVATLECGVGPIFQLDMMGERLAVGGYYDHDPDYPRPTAPVEVWNWTSRERLCSIAEDASGVEEGFAICLNGGLAALTGEMNSLIHLYDWPTNALLQVVDPEVDRGKIGGRNGPGRVSIVGNYLLYQEVISDRIDVWTTAERRYCGHIAGSISGQQYWGAVPFFVDGRLYVRDPVSYQAELMARAYTSRPSRRSLPSSVQTFSCPVDEKDSPGLCVRHYIERVSVAIGSGEHLVVCSDVVKIRDSTSEAVVGLLEGHSDAICSVDRLEDAIITTSEDGTARIWDWPPAVVTPPAIERDAEVGERIKRFYQPSVTGIAIQGSSAFVGTCSSLEEWNWSEAEMVNAVSLSEPIQALAVNDKWLAFSSFWRPKDGKFTALLRTEWARERPGGEFRRTEASIVSDGKFDFLRECGVLAATLLGDTCAAVVRDGYDVGNHTGSSIYVIDLRRDECELVLGEWISVVALSPHIVAGGTVEGHIDIWERATGRLKRRLSNHSGPIAALQIEGNRLLSCSSDRTAQVWDLTTFDNILILPHDAAVNALRARSGLLVTSSEDHILRVFDLQGGTELARFTDDAPLVACEITTEPTTIICGGKSGQLHILGVNAPLSAAISNPK